jgi:hypothetical protein
MIIYLIKEFSDYNGIIINYYENGLKYIEKHSDSQNHPPNGVLLISYGGLRKSISLHKYMGLGLYE